MKQKVKVVADGKVIEGERTIPNKIHLQAQINLPSRTFKPRKGKGSFRRKSKYGEKF